MYTQNMNTDLFPLMPAPTRTGVQELIQALMGAQMTAQNQLPGLDQYAAPVQHFSAPEFYRTGDVPLNRRAKQGYQPAIDEIKLRQLHKTWGIPGNVPVPSRLG